MDKTGLVPPSRSWQSCGGGGTPSDPRGAAPLCSEQLTPNFSAHSTLTHIHRMGELEFLWRMFASFHVPRHWLIHSLKHNALFTHKLAETKNMITHYAGEAGGIRVSLVACKWVQPLQRQSGKCLSKDKSTYPLTQQIPF